MEARSRHIQYDDLDFRVVAENHGIAGDSAVSARLLRANLNQTSRLQFARKSPRVFARRASARRRISRDARARHETVCRFVTERRLTSLLARRHNWQRFRELSGA